MTMEPYETQPSAGYLAYQCSWKLIKPHFLMAFVFILVFFLSQMLLAIIPFIGNLLSGFASTIMTAGIFHAANKWYQGQSAEIEDLFIGIQNKELFGRIWPLAAVSALATTLPSSFDFVTLPLGSLGGELLKLTAIIVSSAISGIVYFAVALALFDHIEIMEGLETALKGILKNWVSLLLSVAVALGAGLACLLTLGLGFIVFFPVAVFSGYFWYLGIFRGLSLETYLKPPEEAPISAPAGQL